MPHAIVTKLRTGSGNALGFVQPYVIELGDGLIRESTREDFPNRNSIFVAAYEKIDEKIPNGAGLFRIPYSESDRYHPDDYDSCRYRALGFDAEPLGAREYFHVIENGINFQQHSVIDIPYQPVRWVFLKWDDQCYVGPFFYEKPEAELNDMGRYKIHFRAERNLFGDGSKDWYVLKISRESFPIITIGNERVMVARLNDLRNKDHEIVDFISPDQLLKWGNDFLPDEHRLVKKDLSVYREAIQQIVEIDSEFTKRRKERLVNLIHKTDLWLKERSRLINDFLSTNEGKQQLEAYVEANWAKFEEDNKERFKSITERYEREESDLQVRLEQIREEINEQQRLLEQTKTQFNKKQQEDLSHENQQLEQQLQQKKRDLQDTTSRLSIANNIQELQEEARVLERVNEIERRKISELKEVVKHHVEEINHLEARKVEIANLTTAKVREKLDDFKPYIDLLNGIIPSKIQQSDSLLPSVIRRENRPGEAKELIDEVLRTLIAFGRDYEFEDIANYLVSIHQHFLTVFAGLPGIGKTSLVTYLSKAIGLEKYDRFLSLSVARGWTSQRDILGFYNPLSGSFQASATGLYEVLKGRHLEYQQEQIQYPYWVLLDEANLSPIEHYWSSFLGMCDDHSDRKIKTGDPQTGGQLALPKSLRFLATINYDSTTEPLSPRMIDRVPVILLTSTARTVYIEDNSETANTPEALLSYEDFSQLFDNLRSPEGLNTDEQRLLDKASGVLADSNSTQYSLPIIISPRKRRLIRDYCNMARELLKEKYALRALDFAIAQYILPIINGSGPNYGKRLRKLREAIDPLDYSKNILQRIIDTGDSEYQFYRFFS